MIYHFLKFLPTNAPPVPRAPKPARELKKVKGKPDPTPTARNVWFD